MQQKPEKTSVKDLISTMNLKSEELKKLIEQEEQEDRANKGMKQEEQELNESSNKKKFNHQQAEGTTKTSECPLPPPQCEHNKHGFCKTHKVIGRQIEVTSSSWKDRGKGRGFGFVKSKVKKYICPSRNLPVVPTISTSNIHATSNMTSRLAMRGGENSKSSRTNILRSGADGISVRK